MAAGWDCHALIGPPQKQSPRTVHDDMDGPPGPSMSSWTVRGDHPCRHGRSPHAVDGPPPGPSMLPKIIVKKGSGIIFGCSLIRRSRNVLAIYELPSSNEDQMEFRYKHWCGRAERGRTHTPPCRRYSGGTVTH